MILHDEGLEVEAEKITDLMRSAGLEFPDYYAKFFVANMKD